MKMNLKEMKINLGQMQTSMIRVRARRLFRPKKGAPDPTGSWAKPPRASRAPWLGQTKPLL
tara:strand:+ start:1474 stop:1656 length:183 start_codon:yes stop_codon:yes gene_type:complete